MDQTPNCRKCTHCYYDEQWREDICDKDKRAIYSGEEALSCRHFKEREANTNAD